MKNYGVKNQEEYDAVVHYLLERDSRVLQTISGHRMPTELIFGAKEVPKGAKVFQWRSPAPTIPLHVCTSPCDGSGILLLRVV